MIQFTKQQLDNRWDILPINLREILCSPDRGKIIWDVCEANHLTDEKIGKIARLCGFVIMGLLHQEDLVKEIKENVGLHLEVADIIAKEVERKIFSPIKSEIDKAYALPISGEEEEIEEAEGGEITESVVTDIRRETGGVKITREVKYAQPAEVEPMRIVASGGEEKLVIPGAEPEKIAEIPKPEISKQPEPIAPVMPEGPVVLHEEEEIRPIFEEAKKKSLGELFGFLNGKEGAVKKEAASVAGEIQIDKINSDVSVGAPTPFGRLGETNKTNRINETNGVDEIDRVVHYDSALSTPIGDETNKTNEINEINEMNEANEPGKAESKPKLFFKNIFQAFKPTVKVVDFTEAPEAPKEEAMGEIQIDESNASNKTDMADKIDVSDGIDKTNEINVINMAEEAPKIIAEEEFKGEPKEEAPAEEKTEEIPKKESFFRKFLKFKRNKNIEFQREQAATEETPTEISVIENESKGKEI
ncbi:MAG: hypothetical protein M1170_02985 [Patescibacteria group bacterium]|nr:hypothetical protein [Patescibacteria group bacterium]